MVNTDVRIGFIGFGNMGQAIAQGLISARVVQGQQIMATASHFERLKANTERIGVQAVQSAAEIAKLCNIVVVAVKPYQVKNALEPIKQLLVSENRFVLSVVGGYTHQMYQEVVVSGTHLICAIPNTPIAVGKGILVTENPHNLSVEQYQMFTDIFSPIALIEQVPTSQLSIATTVAGCAPAFTAMYLEALADAGVKYGLLRESAYRLGAQMIEGTGALYLQTGMNPGAMKDQVTSPGGTTIKGVAALEKNCFRGAIIEAVDAIEGI